MEEKFKQLEIAIAGHRPPASTAAGEQAETTAATTTSSTAAGAGRASAGGGGSFGTAGGAAPSGVQHGERGFSSNDSSVVRQLGGLLKGDKVPMYPQDQSSQISWYYDLHTYMTEARLAHTLEVDSRTGPVDVISSNPEDLFFQHPENVIEDHTRAWSIIRVSVSGLAGSDLRENLRACANVPDAWSALKDWVLPTTDAEQSLLEAELANVQYQGNQSPKRFFSTVNSLVNRLKLVGITKSEKEVIRIILNCLPSAFHSEVVYLKQQKKLTKRQVETTIIDAYATACLKRITDKQPTKAAAAAPAAPSDPHAFFVGGYQSAQSGNGRGGSGGASGRGRGFQGNQGSGYGGAGFQGKQGSGYGGVGGSGYGGRWQQRSQPQQVRQQSRPEVQSKPKHFPPPEHPNWGQGGDYDCGSNAAYPQRESPPPPNAIQGEVYRCARCARHGHHLSICDAPRRFEGNCGWCGQYGHKQRDCALRRRELAARANKQPHVNVMAPDPSWMEPCGEDIPWQGQPEEETQSYGIVMAPNRGISPPQPPQPHSGPDQQQQQQQDSGGGPDWSTSSYWEGRQEQQDGQGQDNEDDDFIHPDNTDVTNGGLMACTYGGAAAEDMARIRARLLQKAGRPYFLSLKPEDAAPAHVLSALIPPEARGSPDISVFVADSAATVHATGDGRYLHNKRSPTPREAALVVGDGRKVEVAYYGDLDVMFYSERRRPARVTIRDMAVVKGLQFDLFSLNKSQDYHDVFMNRTGTYTLEDKVHFTKFPTGNYIAAVRLEPGGNPPPMLAALMRPGPQRSIDVNDLPLALGHAHDSNAVETARQRKIKVTGYRDYCGGCGETKAIKMAVPKSRTDEVAVRPAKRFYFDTTRPFPLSAGKSRYCVLIVDDKTNMCWPLFTPDKSSSTTTKAVRTWYIANREQIKQHGGWEIGRFDNGTEYASAEFKELLRELGVKTEFTPPSGPKRNGRVERRLALIAEGAKAGWAGWSFHCDSRTWSSPRRRETGG